MEHDATVDMDKTKLNTSEASRLTGKGRSTIKRHADKGKLSFELDENGLRLFDRSELERVYADDIRKVAVGRRKSSPGNSEEGGVALKTTRDKLIAQYEDRINHLEKNLDKALSIAGLLESSGSERKEWETVFEAKTEQLANDTARQMEELREKHREDMGKLLGALKNEVNKPLWKRIFGSKKRVGTVKRNPSNA